MSSMKSQAVQLAETNLKQDLDFLKKSLCALGTYKEELPDLSLGKTFENFRQMLDLMKIKAKSMTATRNLKAFDVFPAIHQLIARYNFLIELVYFWSTFGLLLVYFWSTFGLLLVYF